MKLDQSHWEWRESFLNGGMVGMKFHSRYQNTAFKAYSSFSHSIAVELDPNLIFDNQDFARIWKKYTKPAPSFPPHFDNNTRVGVQKIRLLEMG